MAKALAFITSERAHTTEDILRLMIDHDIVAWQSSHNSNIFRLCVNRDVRGVLLSLDMRFAETGHRDTRRAFWMKVDFSGSKKDLIGVLSKKFSGMTVHHYDGPGDAGTVIVPGGKV